MLLNAEKESNLAPGKSHHRRRSSIYVSSQNQETLHTFSQSILPTDPEKRALALAPPTSSVRLPEIRITLPAETAADGNVPERVIVVHLNDKSAEVGLEPVHDDPLPPYERFESLDLSRLGGLKENVPKAGAW